MGFRNFFRKILGGKAPQEEIKPVEAPHDEAYKDRHVEDESPAPIEDKDASHSANTAEEKAAEKPPEARAQKQETPQFHHPPPKRKSRDIVIGLDFGTSCSKVVIGDNLSGQHYAVPAKNIGLTNSLYLHGGILYKSPTKGYSLDPHDDGKQIQNIKMRLMEGKKAAELDSAIYLAMLVRRAIKWLKETHEEDYRNVDFSWHLNLGLPAKDATDSKLTEKYNRIARTALSLALEDRMTIQRARQLLDPQNGHELAELASRVSIYPEVAAELEAFRRADYFEPGKYLLADVGAGTLDIATFAIGNGMDFFGRFTFYSMDVAPLGAFKLHEARLESLKNVGLRANQQVAMEQLAYRIPHRASDYLDGEPENRENIFYHLNAADREFSEKATRSITSIVMATHVNLSRHHRQPLSPFRDGLDVFLCGGGARLDFFQSLIGSVESRLRDYLTWDSRTGLTSHNLPLPQDLTAPGISREDYDRIAVAYGLSFQAMDLPEIHVADLKTEVEQTKRSGVLVDVARLDQIVQDIYYPPRPPYHTWREVPLRRPVTLSRLMNTELYRDVPSFKVRQRYGEKLGREVNIAEVIPDEVIIDELAVNQLRPRFAHR